MLKELYNYRELLKTNVKKEIRGKYKVSFLGVLWSFINPLLTALIYAIVFPFVLKNTDRTPTVTHLAYRVVLSVTISFSKSQGIVAAASLYQPFPLGQRLQRGHLPDP